MTNSRTASAMRARPPVSPGHAATSSISRLSIAGGSASNRCARSGRPASIASLVSDMGPNLPTARGLHRPLGDRRTVPDDPHAPRKVRAHAGAARLLVTRARSLRVGGGLRARRHQSQPGAAFGASPPVRRSGGVLADVCSGKPGEATLRLPSLAKSPLDSPELIRVTPRAARSEAGPVVVAGPDDRARSRRCARLAGHGGGRRCGRDPLRRLALLPGRTGGFRR